MMVVTVWHGRDAYDYTLSPMLHQTFKGLDDTQLKEMVAQHDKYIKGGSLPWYLITATRFEIGSEPITENYHRANPPKTKIVLNARAKPDPKLKKTVGDAKAIANLWAEIHAAAPLVGGNANGNVPVDFFAPHADNEQVFPHPVPEGHY